jgi:hypothetical protein
MAQEERERDRESNGLLRCGANVVQVVTGQDGAGSDKPSSTLLPVAYIT